MNYRLATNIDKFKESCPAGSTLSEFLSNESIVKFTEKKKIVELNLHFCISETLYCRRMFPV